ncbi:ferritin-like domain-containing protein [Sphaerotilus uruguayifluvii]|uniref:Rubrerythrin n=1 Tax=Sphaerotilus uruguayifluvii TaxID=2735897 RepID=A0ABX2FZD6_9BURK|nr:ferritin-like domain-containing protein [Leptothrix sp. C29]NRT55380.1 rubrerythrin [Leptothrix sp. C29]
MNDVERFLAHAIALEREAARRYEELAAAMQTDGRAELKAFFARMAHFSRLHLAEAQARGQWRDLPVLAEHEYDWPDGIAPETADWAGVDAQMTVRSALELALESERRGHAYYAAVAALAQDPDVRHLAAEFAAEEAEHLAELERRLHACAA